MLAPFMSQICYPWLWLQFYIPQKRGSKMMIHCVLNSVSCLFRPFWARKTHRSGSCIWCWWRHLGRPFSPELPRSLESSRPRSRGTSDGSRSRRPRWLQCLINWGQEIMKKLSALTVLVLEDVENGQKLSVVRHQGLADEIAWPGQLLEGLQGSAHHRSASRVEGHCQIEQNCITDYVLLPILRKYSMP